MQIHPQFDPIAFSLGPLSVRWYGLMYLIAFVLFVVLGRLHARRRPELGWDAQMIDDLLLYAGEASEVLALVARDKRLLRLPLQLPASASPKVPAKAATKGRKPTTKNATSADTVTLSVADEKSANRWLDGC